MDYRLLFKILGAILTAISFTTLLPVLYGLSIHDKHTANLLLTAIFGTCLGLSCWLKFKDHKGKGNTKTTFAIVIFTWMICSLVGAFPYYITNSAPTFLDSLFESISGFTCTGATIFTNVENIDPAVLLWRSFTQWLGGLGIVFFFIALIPLLGVGGMQLFKVESTGLKDDQLASNLKDTAKWLWLIYLSLTTLLAVILKNMDMTWFDAINHAFTTISTGGFSLYNNGIAHYDSLAVNYVLSIFMLISSTSFTVHYHLLIKNNLQLSKNSELKAYYLTVMIAVAIIFCAIIFNFGLETHKAFNYALFSVAATISTTGFTNYDYSLLPAYALVIFMIIMPMGGMSGSTAGGVKCIRIVALFKIIFKELKRTLHPHAVLGIKANDRVIVYKTSTAICALVFMYLTCALTLSLILSFDGFNFITALSASFSALSNIGPALGNLGPYANYSELSALSKISYAAAMIIGRLEFFTVLVIFTKDFWKRY